MKRPAPSKEIRGLGAWLLLGYALLAWTLLSDQWLPFPHGADDQLRAARAAGAEVAARRDSWVAQSLDPIAARLSPRGPYPILQILRRVSVTVGMVGMTVWIARSMGWVQGFWAALLGLCLLPPRLAGIGLASQGLALAPMVWGYSLILGKPWSKTGEAEVTGGGFLLGLSIFAAPWSWLFVASLPIHALRSKELARKLDSGFWSGLLLGIVPGVIWALEGESGGGRDFGIHWETLTPSKLSQIGAVLTEGWGGAACTLGLAGIVGTLGQPGMGPTRWAGALTWPLLPLLVFGIADSISTSLAFPGLLLYCLEGLGLFGRVFVSRAERLLLPTLLVGGLGYHTYFAGLDTVRAWQGFARDEAAVARLVLEKVHPEDAVILFRLDPILDYLATLHPGAPYRIPPLNPFAEDRDERTRNLTELAARHRVLWIEPRGLENWAPSREGLLAELREDGPVEVVTGSRGVELWKIHLSHLRQKDHSRHLQPGLDRGNSTTPSRGESVPPPSTGHPEKD